jgi:preprotein translocase subunit SecG
MFTTVILAIHILVCVALIMIILLQSGKGADIGAVFGGGSSNTLFGSTGATPFLSKLTIGVAVMFMVTSIFLTYFSGRSVPKEFSVMDQSQGVETPVTAPSSGAGTQPGQEGAAKREGAPAETGAAPTNPAPLAPATNAQPAPGGAPAPAPESTGTSNK